MSGTTAVPPGEHPMFSWSAETKSYNAPNGAVDFTEVTLRNEHGEYTIRVRRTELDVGGMVEDLLKPMMLAAGYAEKNVNEMMGDSE
jgi:hypothetical protein